MYQSVLLFRLHLRAEIRAANEILLPLDDNLDRRLQPSPYNARTSRSAVAFRKPSNRGSVSFTLALFVAFRNTVPFGPRKIDR